MKKLGSFPGFVIALLGLSLALAAFVACEKTQSPPPPKLEPAVDLSATKAKAEQGDAAAQNILGDLSAHGKGVPQDYAEAAKWYRQAADQGLAVAQCNLASLYAAGAGVKADPAEALKWYRKAADQGSADAQYNLAQMLSMGIGAKRDIREAIRLYHLAAEQGDGLSQFNLARRYQEGKDVSPDRVDSYFWFSLATENGVEGASEMRDGLKKQMPRQQVAEAERKIAGFKSAPRRQPGMRDLPAK
ncbi:MAG: tetratricopeptide repeat protein [Verrucomicrobiota bacterium]